MSSPPEGSAPKRMVLHRLPNADEFVECKGKTKCVRWEHVTVVPESALREAEKEIARLREHIADIYKYEANHE
jgi:hypothetical protein